MTVELATTIGPSQLIALAFGNEVPEGKTVRYDQAVPPLTVMLIAAAVAFAGTSETTETVMVVPGPSL